MNVTETASNRVLLDLPEARGRVEVSGALGVVAKVEIDGERARPQRGGWAIPLKSGGTDGRLVVKGFLPGFQRFMWKDDEVLRLGAHVGLAEKIAMFVPFLLIFAWVYLAPVSLVLFLMNVPVVKNPLMPRALRIALPIINTVAVFVGWIAIATLIGSRS